MRTLARLGVTLLVTIVVAACGDNLEGPNVPNECVATDDGNPCTQDLCINGSPSHVPLAPGSECPAGVCNSIAQCVGCLVNTDCTAPLECNQTTHACTAPTCTDNLKNGDESDIDCGGSCSPARGCVDGRACVIGDDCQSGVCGAFVCQAPACGDGVRQGTEACDDGNQTNGDGCDDGVGGNCKPTGCGNGVTAGTEECDDSNTTNGDGCDNNCTSSRCGNGVIAGTEVCDDSNVVAGDGCSDSCTIEPGFTCVGTPSVCVGTCGDGLVVNGEQCDDPAPAESGDGCSITCTVELGYTCTGSPSTCATSCGDGVRAGTEGCDDAPPAEDGDGCSANCLVEPGWACIGTPSVCFGICGDGLVRGAETCDDAPPAENGDGCSASCRVEPGFACTGEPSTCRPVCGDGIVLPGEACDDAPPAEDGDGCSAACTVELGYTCSGSPSVCTRRAATASSRAPRSATTLHPPRTATAARRLAPSSPASFAVARRRRAPRSAATGSCVVPSSATTRHRPKTAMAAPLPARSSPASCAPASRARASRRVATASSTRARAATTRAPPASPACASRSTTATAARRRAQWSRASRAQASRRSAARSAATASRRAATTVAPPARPGVCEPADNGDGCSEQCTLECGDGAVQAAVEQCDDGNRVAGDGCSDTCSVEISCGTGETPVVVSNRSTTQLADNDDAGVISSITIPTAGLVRSVIPVLTSITHPDDSNLDIFLSPPFGPERRLVDDETGVNYRSTIFRDDAAISTTATAAVAPYTGLFKPEETLAGHANQSAQGAWHLRIGDDAIGNVGTLDAWALAVCVDTWVAEVCGNAIVEATETCDDLNLVNGDGCSASCQLELVCAVGTPVIVRSTDAPQVIHDNNPTTPATLTVTVTANGTVRRAVVVLASVLHTFDGNLDISLVSPALTVVDVTSDNGAGADNFISTIFDDTAPTTIPLSGAPFRGLFKPDTPLAAVEGQPAAGVWTLKMVDDSGGDVGLFKSWILGLCVQ